MRPFNNVPASLRGAFVVSLAVSSALAAAICCTNSDAAATPPPAVAPSDAGRATSASPPPPAAPSVPETAQIVFNTEPPTHATVTWGKKRLGKIAPGMPLVVVRPRDSGPLDVVVRADGFLPVHTRAHTFSDSKVMVKLTPPEETPTLLGYRVPLDAGFPVTPEGLVLPLDGGMVTTP